MKSLISEFSYGFAITHELVLALGTLSAAPIFPSLLEEGKKGGGYDVKLEAPGLLLFLQFKRSECLSRRSAREIKSGAQLSTPYYRMEITGKSDSAQHEMLVELDDGTNLVFYAAPMFHRKGEFDDAFLSGLVRQRSFYVRPSSIGQFNDEKPHHVSFDGIRCVLMSEPREIDGFGARELETLLKERLAKDERPLRQSVQSAIRAAEAASARAHERAGRRQRIDVMPTRFIVEDGLLKIAPVDVFRQRQEETVAPTPPPEKADNPDQDALRRLADIGLREFNAQLFVVQDDGSES